MRERSGSVVRLTAPVRAALQRLALPLLILVSVLLIVLGKTDVLLFDRLRVAMGDAAAPLLQLVAEPIGTVAGATKRLQDMFGVYDQNAELREENARLLRWQEVARRLMVENAQLRDLTKLVPENARSFVSAHVIADSGGAFMRNVMVNAGTRDGVARGQAALNGEGLAGRVFEVGERTARILLLTDLNSRVPVIVEATNDRAVLAGDNTDQPRLLYLEPKATVKVGERVVTGGSGGIFPPGIPVGVISAVEGDVVRVDPFAELSRLDYLRIVDFGLSGVLPQSVIPPPRAPRGRAAAADAAR